MGIYDRDYVRHDRPTGFGAGRPPFGRFSVNGWLIIINVAVFFLSGMVGAGFGPSLVHSPLWAWGCFTTHHVIYHVEFWRVLSFQFLHASFLHLAMNMFGLWLFGPVVEQSIGSKRYLAFFLVCGVFGSLTYLLLNFLGSVVGLDLPFLLFEDPRTPLVGASAGVFGVIIACAHVDRDNKWLVFGLVPMKLTTIAYLYVGAALFNLLIGRGSNVGGDAAHVGGAVAGYFFIRNLHLLVDFFDVFGDSRPGSRTKAAKKRRQTSGPSEEEVDRVLAIVHEQGVGALSESDRSILRQASRRRSS